MRLTSPAVSADSLAEDVRMAADQLAVDGVERIVDGEQLLLGRHLRVEDGLQHEVAELFGELAPLAAVDGVEHLVGLFQGVGLDGVEGLLAVPRAAAGRAQAGHDFDEFLEFFAGTGVVFHGWEWFFSM